MKSWLYSILFLMVAPTVQAQGWGNLDALLFQNLTNSGKAEASYWLPNATDPSVATAALGVVYEHIPGSAGNVGIETGLFVRQANGWSLVGKVSGMFGHEPRNAAFLQGHVDVTTTTLGPNEPRCCPTLPARWRIDLATLRAVQIK